MNRSPWALPSEPVERGVAATSAAAAKRKISEADEPRIRRDILAIQSRINAAGISLGEILREARIDRSMWTRWRNGTVIPRLDNWYAACDAAERLIAERVRNAEAMASGEARP